MFVIGATKKLQDQIKAPIQEAEEYDHVPEIYQWHANLITINRRKCLVLINNQTGLNLTLFGLRKQQFDFLDTVIKGSLKQLYQLLGVKQEVIDEMMKEAEEIVYTKTKSRQLLGMLNEIKFTIEVKTDGVNYEDIDAASLNEFNNTIIFNPLKHSYPKDTFIKYFEKR
ncbi:hypothetical protein EQV77_07630 [Halobacillus fulvus]|nr:hypothetical protein EQV77_07630 [Halobacillus fulvus]